MSRSARFPGPFGMGLLIVLASMPGATPLASQAAQIREDLVTLETYPFSEPDPVPILTRDARLYPYHSFEGYSATAERREWRVVTLENDWIEVFVLPEVGGKIWGAVVKDTGHEFIYRNEVMKFRNIALRGPWTSGGIEFNFGVIGHTPATATPVDYLLRENPDGSVSCFVGGMDLPSRTQWRVEIRLPADRAYFETNVLWYNPTVLEQPYYNWMTAAAFARDDLRMTIPGNAYLEHSGKALAWPVDAEGRDLAAYQNNAFGGHKSYHVVGELNDFFGGYYLEDDYGFGHWARYEDMPGQKLWLWALSREGGIWEDLLTDADGQYVEFQAGRLFVQYSPGEDQNPITQAGFEPVSTSRWTETWFPVEGTGGLTDASREAAMHVVRDGPDLVVTVNAFSRRSDTLTVWSAGSVVSRTPVDLRPLEPFTWRVEVDDEEPYRVHLPGLGLDYDSDPTQRLLSRPFATDPDALPSIPDVAWTVFQAEEHWKARRHDEARELFRTVLAEEPWNKEALLGLADLSYHAGRYAGGLAYLDRVLQLDAYHAEANFRAGTMHRALGRTADARDAFGWAARSVGFRAAAYVQLAQLMVADRDHPEAARYARLALDHDRYSVPAWSVLAVVGRATGEEALVREALDALTAIDPLSHFVRAERYLGDPGSGTVRALVDGLRGEYPDQALLELAIGYSGMGRPGDALVMLALDGAPDLGPVGRAWSAFLQADPAQLAGAVDPALRFPFRRETVEVLQWAALEREEWTWTYLLALNLWAVGRMDEAAELLTDLGERPDYPPAYVARGLLRQQVEGADPLPDLLRAVALDPSMRVLRVYLIRHLQDTGRWEASLAAADEARTRFPDDFNLDLLKAKALNQIGRARESVEILANTRVLPSENARESHRLYEQAHTLVALDALRDGDLVRSREHLEAALEWPESLGQGRPYEPEERLVRFLLGRTAERTARDQAAREAWEAVVRATETVRDPSAEVVRTGIPARVVEPGRLDLLAVVALDRLGRTDDLEWVADAWLAQADAAAEAAAEAGEALDEWAAARFGSALARALLDGEPAREAAPALAQSYPDLFGDLDGRMILGALVEP